MQKTLRMERSLREADLPTAEVLLNEFDCLIENGAPAHLRDMVAGLLAKAWQRRALAEGDQRAFSPEDPEDWKETLDCVMSQLELRSPELTAKVQHALDCAAGRTTATQYRRSLRRQKRPREAQEPDDN